MSYRVTVETADNRIIVSDPIHAYFPALRRAHDEAHCKNVKKVLLEDVSTDKVLYEMPGTESEAWILAITDAEYEALKRVGFEPVAYRLPLHPFSRACMEGRALTDFFNLDGAFGVPAHVRASWLGCTIEELHSAACVAIQYAMFNHVVKRI